MGVSTNRRRVLRQLDDRFIYESAIDEATYTRERDQLREEILLTEMDLADAQVEQIDVEAILASAEDIITNASSLWKEGTLDQRERLQRLLFPEGLKWDRGALRPPTTCLSYYHVAPAPNTVLENGVPFDADFEHSSPSWALIRTWLENIQRFSSAA